MAVSRSINEILNSGINAVFDEVYANHSKRIHNFKPYILEQCGKLYRVKTNNYALGLIKTEYKSGWLKLNEAQAILKLLEVSEDGTS